MNASSSGATCLARCAVARIGSSTSTSSVRGTTTAVSAARWRLKLLQAAMGVDFNTALRDVERCLGMMPVTAPSSCEPSAERMKKLAQRIWNRGKAGDGGRRSRSLPERTGSRPAGVSEGAALPPCPRLLPEADSRRQVTQGGRVSGDAGLHSGCRRHAVTLHRTYLRDGGKLAALDAKKVLSAGINGAAVRLFDATEELAISEGIETGIALHLATGKPVWAGLNAGNLEKLWLPDTVRKVCIYADNDADGDFAGQAFAFALARQLKREENSGRRQVRVFLPRHAGTDWADVWRQRLEAQAPRAA